MGWANRFVPLPPTVFPEEVATNASDSEQSVRGSDIAPQNPLSNPGLPCLQDIAGIDPFFAPMPAPSPQQSLKTNSSTLPPSPPAATDDSRDHSATTSGGLTPPRVEVIGQQIETEAAAAPEPNALPITPASTLAQEQPSVRAELEKSSSCQKPIVEIHDYDIATKVLLNDNATKDNGTKTQNSQEQTAATDNAGSIEKMDISGYWSQDNVSSFIPGVTPIEAYPVCQEYAEQISASGKTESITLSDIELEQLLTTAANIKSETAREDAKDIEAGPSVEQIDIQANADLAVTSNLAPLQVDPFGEDTFEITQVVIPANKSKLQEPRTPATLPVVPQTPNLAARQVPSPPASQSQSAVTETADTQSSPAPQEAAQVSSQLPNENDAGTQKPNSNELFESVEKSLSDLQSINHCDSLEHDSAATDLEHALPANIRRSSYRGSRRRRVSRRTRPCTGAAYCNA